VLDVVVAYVDDKAFHDCDSIEHVLDERIEFDDFISWCFPR